MFLHLSVNHSVHNGEYLGRYPPGQVNHPLGPGTPPSLGTPSRPGTPTPWAGTPPGQIIPWAGTPCQVHPPRQVPPKSYTPPGTRYTPQPGTPSWPGTSPGTRYTPRPGTPPDQVHPPRRQLLLLTVRILLECILVNYAKKVPSCTCCCD